ncbi:MAG: hypothetical protein DRO04_00490 [Candidatus Iainarchaeum archaeon]|uniref:Class III signal peptide-containing protein n=1 Tax=Candidatus Iainarchaeum sp. TaxID=3101447 RepID=A0A497JJ39_9ARCH|nr:MAG: hypothetical protein DRO04_00490 [Candidatus Diapherotrites archaeon]
MQKGQIAIEFILIIVIMLIFLQTIIQPTLTSSITTVKDVSSLAQAKIAAEKIVNAIDFVALNASDSKIEVGIFLPVNTTLKCDPAAKKIYFSSVVSMPHESCEADEDNNASVCTKSISTISTITLNCNAFGINHTLNPTKNSFYKISVKKLGGIVYVETK